MATIGAVTAKFLRSLSVTAAWEGGWSNDPDDPGGKTMYGVTESTWLAFRKKFGLPSKPIKAITRQDAEQLFFSEFWNFNQCERLATGVDLATFDASVNSGVARGRKWLLASIGGSDVQTVKNICARRLTFVEALKNWKKFGRGWSARIADIQAKGVAWALSAAGDKRVVPDQVRDEGDAKSRTAGKQAAGAAGAGTGAGGSVAVDHQAVHVADWVMSGIGLLLVAAVVFLLWRAFLSQQQAKAFHAQAEAM